jgi:uncharacterized membrane protein YedE/YeeE
VSDTPQPRSNNLALAAAGIVLGLLSAAGYGAWRAISDDAASSAARWSAFGEAMLFPGLLIIVAVTAVVWLGWKANIDG